MPVSILFEKSMLQKKEKEKEKKEEKNKEKVPKISSCKALDFSTEIAMTDSEKSLYRIAGN